MIDWNVLAGPQLRHSHRSSESISLLSMMIMTQEVTEHATRKQAQTWLHLNRVFFFSESPAFEGLRKGSGYNAAWS